MAERAPQFRGGWKIIECPECGSRSFNFLNIEGACGELQCSQQNCLNVWWEHPWGKSCKHRKLPKPYAGK